MNDPEGRKTTFRCYLMIASICVAWHKVDKEIETTISAMCSLKSSTTLENYAKKLPAKLHMTTNVALLSLDTLGDVTHTGLLLFVLLGTR